MRPMRIEPKDTALVTGASRGIGRALSVELARRGVRLGLLARGREALEALAAELPESPAGPHLPLAADVTKRGQVQRAIERFAKRAGRIDLLVANAGTVHYAPIADQEWEHAEAMVSTNVLGVLHPVKAAL